jgi:hypothetical protein
MTDFTAIVHRYLDAWNETDPVKRHEVLDEVLTEDAAYTDPLGAVRGRDGLDQFIDGAQRQFAGLTFSLGGTVDGHHDIARFSWHLAPAGADEPIVIGFDVITVENGRISDVRGFLDKVPG